MRTWTVFEMPRAREPNRRDDNVSGPLSLHGEQQTTIAVFDVPPSESWRTLVNLLSLNGMCLFLPSVNDDMTLAKALNDLLIRIP